MGFLVHLYDTCVIQLTRAWRRSLHLRVVSITLASSTVGMCPSSTGHITK